MPLPSEIVYVEESDVHESIAHELQVLLAAARRTAVVFTGGGLDTRRTVKGTKDKLRLIGCSDLALAIV